MAARAERLWVVAGAVAEALIGLLVHRDLPATRSYLKVGLRPARTGGLWSVPLLGLTWSRSRRTGLQTQLMTLLLAVAGRWLAAVDVAARSRFRGDDST